MKVLLTSSRNKSGISAVPAFGKLLGSQRGQTHTECSDPVDADIILFPDCHLTGTDWRLEELSNSEYARKYPEKIYVYDERDRPWCRFPGIYVSMPASKFHRQWQVPASYYAIEHSTDIYPCNVEPDLLFSFMGTSSARCRRDIYALAHPRAHLEEVKGFVFYDPSSPQFVQQKQRFAELMGRSMFMLCPRGAGSSSIRLYECLAAGKVPVIISDEWEAPTGPSWADFSIRWPESRIRELPRHLELRATDFPEMSVAARAAFSQWFAPNVVLTRQLDQLEQLIRWQPRDGFPPNGYRDGAWRQAGAAVAKSAIRHRLSPLKRMAVRIVHTWKAAK